MKTLKSVGAVLAGIILLVSLVILTDSILTSAGLLSSAKQNPYAGMLLVALLYRCIYQILGGYVTAALAPSNPMKHVSILGIIGLVLSLIGVIMSLLGLIPGADSSQNWYPIALAISAYPTVWLGGKARTKNSNP